jgi:predicted dehydrogenase
MARSKLRLGIIGAGAIVRDRHLPGVNHLTDDQGVHLFRRQLFPIV